MTSARDGDELHAWSGRAERYVDVTGRRTEHEHGDKNMKRRNLMMGLGSVAASAAAVTGTGALTSMSATRDFEVDLSSDTDAQVGLEPGSKNGEYAELNQGGGSPDDVLAIELNGQSPGNGEGVNANAVYVFEDLFRIQNQTPEAKGFYITFSKPSGGAYSSGSNVDPSDIDIKFLDSNGNSIVGDSNAVPTGSGSAVHVTFKVDTTNVPNNADISEAGQLLTDVTVNGVDNPS